MERAWRSLDRIKPHVVKWTTSFAQSMQLVVDGEAALSTNPSNRLTPARRDGAPVDFVWDQGLLDFTCWAIPKGTRNRREALQFIAFSTAAKAQAEMMKMQPGGPINLKAFGHLSDDEAKALATYKANLERQLVLNPKWWAEKGPSGKTHYEDYLDQVSGWMSRSGEPVPLSRGRTRDAALRASLQGAQDPLRPRCLRVHSTASAYRASAPCRVGS